MKNIEITYFGILRSITSWAKVSRELLYALNANGVNINVYERKGFLFDPSFSLSSDIETKITGEFKGDVVFTFEHPKNYIHLPEQSFNVGFLVYEFTCLPEFWVEMINEKLDMVFVPSSFCQKVFLDSGVEENKIRVLRYGFNPIYYYPLSVRAKDNDGTFAFLSIASPHKREGIEFLLNSYSRAFSKEDNVNLILKLTYIPSGKIKPFEYPNILGLVNSFRDKKNAPRIEVVSGRLTEKEMGDLYRYSDAYVSLTRGEAFGLCFLEALASGMPVAGVNWSGQADFLNERNSHFIDFSLVTAKDEVYETIPDPGMIALPDLDSAADVMRKLFLNREGNTFRREHYLWSSVAKDFISLVS